jgi:hypothetical protein
LVIGAGALVLMAATARGPLGIARLCGPRAHATLDVFVPIAIGLAPILPALRPEPIAIVVVELAMVATLRVGTLTRYTRAPAVTDNAGAPERGVTSATVISADAAADTNPGTARPKYAPALARGLGNLAGRTARRLPDADAAVRRGAREAGRRVPDAEAALRRGARYAAERAARLTRPDRDAAP